MHARVRSTGTYNFFYARTKAVVLVLSAQSYCVTDITCD